MKPYGAAVVELVDTQDSKSCERKLMRVRLSPAAPYVVIVGKILREQSHESSILSSPTKRELNGFFIPKKIFFSPNAKPPIHF